MLTIHLDKISDVSLVSRLIGNCLNPDHPVALSRAKPPLLKLDNSEIAGDEFGL